LTLAFDMLIKT